MHLLARGADSDSRVESTDRRHCHIPTACRRSRRVVAGNIGHNINGSRRPVVNLHGTVNIECRYHQVCDRLTGDEIKARHGWGAGGGRDDREVTTRLSVRDGRVDHDGSHALRWNPT